MTAPAPASPASAEPPTGLRIRSAVVHGATGYVGRHLVGGLVHEGATVLAVGRSAARLDALRSRVGQQDHGGVLPVVADISTDEGAQQVAARLREHGPIDAGFAAIGGWWEGPSLVNLDTATWTDLLRSHLTAHFHAARATVPCLNADAAAYVTTNGIATLQPEAGSGPISVTGAAQTMLLDVLRAEETRPGVRFHELCVVNPVVDDGTSDQAGEAVVEISEVVAAALRLARTGDHGTAQVRIGRL